VHGIFFQTIMKSCQMNCQITNNIDKILLKFCNISLIKQFTLTMDPIPIGLLKLILTKFKSGGPRPMRPPPRFRHLCPYLEDFPEDREFEQLSSSIGWRVMVLQSSAKKWHTRDLKLKG